MSRHRNVRNFSADDLQDYDEYDDYEEEGELDETQQGYVINRHEGETAVENAMTEEQKAQMRSGYEEIRQWLPENLGVTRAEIEDALWHYYFEVQPALKYLSETVTRRERKNQSNDKKATVTTGETKGQKGAKPKQGSAGKAKGQHSLPPDLSSLSRQVKSAQSSTTSLSSAKLPAPVAAAKKKEEERERQRMIAAADEEAEAEAARRRGGEDIVDDDDDQTDDSQLLFDMSALNLAASAGKHGETGLPPRPPLQQQQFPLAERRSIPRAQSCGLAASGNLGSVSSLSSSAAGSPKGSPKLSRRVNIDDEYAKRAVQEDNMNFVVIGHVDAGKSTLMGHLLYKLGQVSEKDMRKFQRESDKIGKSSFAYAWVLDETDEERVRGVTIDVATARFVTPVKKRRFTLLDAPGHRDFIPNMISGASQADVALLVVDATKGEFEAGFHSAGQTKEHALLVRSLGVQQLVVAVNKMDVADWAHDRFEEISAQLSAFLMSVGFKKANLYFVPCSGMVGENIVSRECPKLKAWYDGPTLVDVFEMFEPPVRPIQKPFRLSVTDFFKGGHSAAGSGGSVSVAGRIEAGSVQVGNAVTVVPGFASGTVKSVVVKDESAHWAVAGDSVILTLSGLELQQLSTGAILCPPGNLVPLTNHFLAQIVVFDVKVPITNGYPVIVHQARLNEPGNISKLVATVDKVNGEVKKRNPRHLPKMTSAQVEIRTQRPIGLETFRDNKEFGRVLLRRGGETVATGIVLKILSFVTQAST